MSEEFDKEAEKEKLRAQLAAEESDRQSTQHMSELLLKGATMTNRGCGQCGDPLFRHEGRTFCPTCGWEPGTAVAEGGDAAEAAGIQAVATDGEPASNASPAGTPPSPGAGGPSAAAASEPVSGPGQPTAVGDGDIPAARAALVRTVTALAREAEATSDVGRARELLAAVREGAEAIRALDATGR